VVRDLAGPNVIQIWWPRRSGSSSMTSGHATPSRENLAKANAAYGLGLIRQKLALTQGSTIAMNKLMINLEKLLELLFVLFTCWLHLLWARGSVNNVHSDPFAAHGVMA